MTVEFGPSIVSDGLAVWVDTDNEKSFRGSPTTNYISAWTPRIDLSYAPFVKTTSGTWQAKHPDAITVFNSSNQDISDHINVGVADWTNTYHAIWVYDDILKKPVFLMRDIDSQWKAPNRQLSMNFSTLGMTAGSKYTVSWLQWTTNINKAANVGLYTRNLSNVADFWDGLSNASSTSKNTKTETWQRVYHTFTVSATRNLGDTYTHLYMYGHYFGTGILKISDVQLELYDVPSNFSPSQTRGSTVGTSGGLKNLADGTNDGSINGDIRQTIYSPRSLTFDGVNDFVLFPLTLTDLPALSSFSMSIWVKIPEYPAAITPFRRGVLLGAAFYAGTAIYWNGDTTGTDFRVAAYIRGADAQRQTTYHSLPLNTWRNVVLVNDQRLKQLKLFINGVLMNSITTATQEYSGSLIPDAGNIGISKDQVDGGGGALGTYVRLKCDVSNVMIYKNRALSDSEVLQNFDALRGRYGV